MTRAFVSLLTNLPSQLKEEQPDLSTEEFDKICSEELAGKLGVSEDLVKAIAFSKSPEKQARAPTMPVSSSTPSAPSQPLEGRVSPPFVTAPTLVDISSPPPVAKKSAPADEEEGPPAADRVARLLKTSSESRFHHFLVGVDGSDASMVGFGAALALRKAKGKLYALHIEVRERGGAVIEVAD